MSPLPPPSTTDSSPPPKTAAQTPPRFPGTTIPTFAPSTETILTLIDTAIDTTPDFSTWHETHVPDDENMSDIFMALHAEAAARTREYYHLITKAGKQGVETSGLKLVFGKKRVTWEEWEEEVARTTGRERQRKALTEVGMDIRRCREAIRGIKEVLGGGGGSGGDGGGDGSGSGGSGSGGSGGSGSGGGGVV